MRKLTHNQFVRNVKEAGKCNVSFLTSYTNRRTDIKAKCLDCGFIIVRGPYSFTAYGCPNCDTKGASLRTLTQKEFMRRVKEKNPNIKVLGPYINRHTRILIQCSKGHKRKVLSGDLMYHSKNDCLECPNVGKSSKVAIEFIERLSKATGLVFQHSSYKGEYKVPGTNLRVDGYNKRRNIAVEFYGDLYHGNIKRYGKRKKQYMDDGSVTVLSLYKKTKAREKIIRAKGIRLYTIWESDFHNNFDSWLSKRLSLITA